MTLGEVSDHQSEYIGNMNKLSLALKDSLQIAQEQGRVTCGIYATANMLEACPDHVMFCVLPVTSCGVVEKDLQCTLIEAFCSENDVRLIKVDSSERLAKLLGEKKKPVNDNDFAAGRRGSTSTLDFNCVLVQYPEDGDVSDMEKMILYYYKTCDEEEPHPYIPLPA
ncbi:growth arrest and DNA damage-inducible protein GADD45 gamma-like [Lineus longissimus]|uniref:growth arrest and DNA damage-inducible protein GADD45 gamma-like n=1 Tax=Lineus longissimus TaxID=88925 RepID=UPI002B4D807C